MVCVLWQGRSTCIFPHTQPAAAASLPAQIHQCFSWLWAWWMLFIFYSGSYSLSIILLSLSPLQQSLYYSLSDAGFSAHVTEMYFLVCSVCMWLIPCAIKRFLVHTLLVTTLKKHMSAAVRMCCSYSVFWGFCGIGFSEFLKVLLWVLGGFLVVFYFIFEGIFNYWNLLSIETFCGIKLYCTDQKFPCWMQEDGLDGFLFHFCRSVLLTGVGVWEPYGRCWSVLNDCLWIIVCILPSGCLIISPSFYQMNGTCLPFLDTYAKLYILEKMLTTSKKKKSQKAVSFCNPMCVPRQTSPTHGPRLSSASLWGIMQPKHWISGNVMIWICYIPIQAEVRMRYYFTV